VRKKKKTPFFHRAGAETLPKEKNERHRRLEKKKKNEKFFTFWRAGSVKERKPPRVPGKKKKKGKAEKGVLQSSFHKPK